MQSFLELGASSRVAQALAERDIHTPFRVQTLVLPDALAGRDVLAKSPTGSGQDAAFAVPIVERLDAGAPAERTHPRADARARRTSSRRSRDDRPRADLRVAAVYGDVTISAQAKKAREAHILVATPGRLQDLVDRRVVKLDGVRILVLDEADQMLDMGFQPQVDKIVARLPQKRQTMFFSATLDGEVGELARAYTTAPPRVEGSCPSEQGESSTASSPSRPRTRSRPSPASCRRSAASPWCSSGRSAAPTGSSASSPGTTSALSPCTATWARASASAR